MKIGAKHRKHFLSVLILSIFAIGLFGNFILSNFIPLISASPSLPNPEHLWLFDQNLSDTGLGTPYDLSGYQIGYTTNDEPASQLFGKSLDCNGTMYTWNTTFLDSIYTDYSSTGFSLEVWFYLMNQGVAQNQYILQKKLDSTGNDLIELRILSNTEVYLKIGVQGEGTVTFTYTFYGGVPWKHARGFNHLVFTMASNGELNAYWNYNQQVNSSSAFTQIPNDNDATGDSFYVGKPIGTWSKYDKRQISKVAFYNSVLTGSEIYELYWEGTKPPTSGDWIVNHYTYAINKTVEVIDGQIPSTVLSWQWFFINSTLRFTNNAPVSPWGIQTLGSLGAIWNFTNSKLENGNVTSGKIPIAYQDSVHYQFKDSNLTTYTTLDFRNSKEAHFENLRLINSTSPFQPSVSSPVATPILKDIIIINFTVTAVIVKISDAVYENFSIIAPVDETSDIAVAFYNIDNTTFKDFYIKNWGMLNPHHALYLQKLTNCTIKNGLVEGAGGNGISLLGTEADMAGTEIVNVTFDGLADGIDDQVVYSYVKVRNCTFKNTNDFVFSMEYIGSKVECIDCIIEKSTRNFHFSGANCTVSLLNTTLERSDITNQWSSSSAYAIQEWNFSDINVSVNSTYTQNTDSVLCTATYSGDNLYYTLSAFSGNITVSKVYCGSKGEPTIITGETSSNYDAGTHILTVNVTHSSSQQILVNWFPLYESPPITSETSWYMRSDSQTVNTVTGYILRETATTTSTYISASDSGDLVVYYGWRVWKVNSQGKTTELTSDYIKSWRIINGTGTQNILWTTPSADLSIGFDAIKIVLYLKLGESGSWQAKAIFISNQLLEKSIVSAQWGFQVYTKRVYSGGVTTGYVYWGDSTYVTSIAGIEFEDPDVYEVIDYKLKTGDLIGAIVFPYVNLIGNLFYGLVMLMICVPLYNRYRSVVPILILFIIFGGAAGIFTLLIPVAGASIGWIFMLLGLAGLLYKVFR